MYVIWFAVLTVDVEVFKQGSHEVEARKMMIGSRPPRCLNRCLNCNPCVATLVVTPHHRKGFDTSHNHDANHDDNYYLLAWECKCGNKLFQPWRLYMLVAYMFSKLNWTILSIKEKKLKHCPLYFSIIECSSFGALLHALLSFDVLN